MYRFLVVWLFATSTQCTQFGPNVTTISDSSLNLQLCEGTTTYGGTPLDTVTVTVTDEYNFQGNDSRLGDLYYTPPPPCVEVINTGLAAEVITETSSTTGCHTDTISIFTSSKASTRTTANLTTSSTIAPYLNRTLSTITVCLTTTFTRTSTRDSNTTAIWTAVTDGSEYSASKAGSSVSPPSTQVISYLPPPTDVASRPGFQSLSASSMKGPRVRVTVTVTKKTPAPAPKTYTGDNTVPTFPTGPTIPTPTDAQNKPSLAGPQPPNGPASQPKQPGQSAPDGSRTDNNNIALPTSSDSNDNMKPGTTGGNGIGSIINSAFNSPFQTVGFSTSWGIATPTVNLVNGVPVQVGASSVFIGGQMLALPSVGSTALVTVNGQTITVAPNMVMGGSDSLTIQRSESVSSQKIFAAPLAASTITYNGIVVTIEPDNAILSGHTFRIGINAPATTTIASGQTITFNSDGVIFPSTTFNPAITTGPAYVVTTVGKLTFSVDMSEAIVSGTTYRIGIGAMNPATTKVIDGTTIVFGSSGIVVASTTIAPTEITGSLRPASGASGVTKAVANTQSTSSSAAISISRSSHIWSDLWCISLWMLACLTLPLSLLL